MSDHFLSVEVSDEEAYVVALNLLPSQDDKILGSSHHEAREHLAQQTVDVVQLFDGN